MDTLIKRQEMVSEAMKPTKLKAKNIEKLHHPSFILSLLRTLTRNFRIDYV
jgi:hypothetical protein